MNTRVHTSTNHRVGRGQKQHILRVLRTTKDKIGRIARVTVDNPNRRAVLKLLCSNNNGVTYQTVFDSLPVSERWARQLIGDLRRAGIVRTPGNPALIQFTSREIEVAVRELLEFIAAGWVEKVKHIPESLPQSAPHRIEPSVDDYYTDYLKTMADFIRRPPG